MRDGNRFDKMKLNEFYIQSKLFFRDKGVQKMGKISFDYSKAAGFISEEEISYMSKLVADAKEQLHSGKYEYRYGL